MLTGAQITKEQQDSIQESLSFFNTALLIFALVALFVGSFIIFNTFSIIVAQRTREMALLRAVGASGRQVTSSVLAESVARRPVRVRRRACSSASCCRPV